MPDQPTLWDIGPPVPGGSGAIARRSQARRLMSRVEDVTSEMGPEYRDKALRVAREAENIGAHSVARALRWAARYDTYDRHGFEAVDCRVERVARLWLKRAEGAA